MLLKSTKKKQTNQIVRASGFYQVEKQLSNVEASSNEKYMLFLTLEPVDEH